MSADPFRTDLLFAANLKAAQQCTKIALEGLKQLIDQQCDALHQAYEWGEDEYNHILTENSALSPDYIPELIKHRLELAAEITRSYFNLADQYQNGLTRLEKALIPGMRQYLENNHQPKREASTRA